MRQFIKYPKSTINCSTTASVRNKAEEVIPAILDKCDELSEFYCNGNFHIRHQLVNNLKDPIKIVDAAEGVIKYPGSKFNFLDLFEKARATANVARSLKPVIQAKLPNYADELGVQSITLTKDNRLEIRL